MTYFVWSLYLFTLCLCQWDLFLSTYDTWQFSLQCGTHKTSSQSIVSCYQNKDDYPYMASYYNVVWVVIPCQLSTLVLIRVLYPWGYYMLTVV